MKKLSAILIGIYILGFATTSKSDQSEGISESGPLSSILLLSSPNGGENLTGNDDHDISWVYNNISAVDLRYSTDNGANWLAIEDHVMVSSNSYPWTVPNISSYNCLVKILVSNNPSVYDVSNNVFTIQISTQTDSIIPIARYSIDESGTDGIIWGARLVSGFGMITTTGLADFLGELSKFLGHEAFGLFFESMFPELHSQQPKYVSICSRFSNNSNKQVTNDDIIFLLEYERDLKMGHPHLVTYKKGKIDIQSSQAPPVVGEIISKIVFDIDGTGEYKDVGWLGSKTNDIIVPILNKEFHTLGVVSGYVKHRDRVHMIMQQYDTMISFGLQWGTGMNFVAVEVSDRQSYPEIGSVVHVEGKIKYLWGVIEQEYEWWYAEEAWAYLNPTKLDILNGRFLNYYYPGSSLFYVNKLEMGNLVGLNWPDILSGVPDFEVESDDITVNPYGSIQENVDYTVNATIHNMGDEGGCEVRFYYAKIDDDHLIGGESILSIPADDEYTVSIQWRPNNLQINYYEPMFIYAIVGSSSPPENIDLNNKGYIERYYSGYDPHLALTSYCPVSLKVMSPDGKIVSKELQEIEGSKYLIDDYDDNGLFDNRVYIPCNESGISYSIEVIPESYATSEDTFTVTVREGGSISTLAENEKIENIPQQPYSYVTTNINEINNIPIENYLFPNYPNPFNPQTSIKYSIQKATHIKISIFNLKGERIKTLKDEYESVGFKHIVWDGKNNFNEKMPSGQYILLLETDKFKQSRKLLLMK